MSNNYYNHASQLTAGTKAKAEDVNSRMNGVEDGFDKLPAPHASAPGTKGFSEPFVISDATAIQHPISAKQAANSSFIYAEAGGAANALTAALPIVPAGYSAGMEVLLKISTTNSGSVTINVDSLGIKNVKKLDDTSLIGGELIAGKVIKFRYDGTNFILVDGIHQLHAHNELYEPVLGSPSVSGMVLSSTGAGVRSWQHHLPVGSVIIWRAATVPTGFLENNGAAISRTTYASLFAVIGTTYGVGNGSTTFNIPDDRGEFLRGWAHGSTNDPDKASRTARGDGTGGDVIGSKQADELKSHSHSAQNQVTLGTAYYGSGWLNTDVGNTGSTGGNETRPRNVNVMFCIKY